LIFEDKLNTRTRQILLLILVLVVVAAATIPVIIYIKALWPIYIIAVFWLCVLRKPATHKTQAAIITTLLFLVSTHFWALILAATYTGDGIMDRLQIIQNLGPQPHKTVMYLLTTYYGLDLPDKVRSTWALHQIWFLPVLFGLFMFNTSRLDPHEKDSAGLHGSAQKADPAQEGLLKNKEGFLLGWTKNWLKQEVVLPLKEIFEHIMIVGAPGAGKSAGNFIPNLLRLSKHPYANVVVTDPKMELLSICGPELQKAGYNIMVFHPYAPEISSAWNMMYYADDYESVDDMVLSIIRNSKESASKGDGEYWDQQANQLLNMICYDLRVKLGEEATINHVQAMAGASKPANIEVILRNSENPKVRMNAAGFFARIKENPKVVGNIMANMPRMFKLWTIDPIRAVTSKNEIDFSKLCSNKKTILFVVTPMDKKDQLRPLFATFFSQLFKVVQEKGRELGKLPRPLCFYLDEFANLGHIPGFQNFLTVVRGYRVSVVMGIQSRSQLEENYEKNGAETIMNSCATYIFGPRVGLDDAKYFSEMIGDETRLVTHKMHNRNLLYTELKHRVSEQSVKRRLITPDEIRKLSKTEDLLVIAGDRGPVHVAPPLYFKDSQWKELAKIGQDEALLQERRLLFYRTEPLTVPSEQEMMEEAALITTPGALPQERKHKENDDPVPGLKNNKKDKNPGRTPQPEHEKDIEAEELGDSWLIIEDDLAPTPTGTQEIEPIELQNKQPPPQKKDAPPGREREKDHTAPQLDKQKKGLNYSKVSVKKVQKGNPFK